MIKDDTSETQPDAELSTTRDRERRITDLRPVAEPGWRVLRTYRGDNGEVQSDVRPLVGWAAVEQREIVARGHRDGDVWRPLVDPETGTSKIGQSDWEDSGWRPVYWDDSGHRLVSDWEDECWSDHLVVILVPPGDKLNDRVLDMLGAKNDSARMGLRSSLSEYSRQ